LQCVPFAREASGVEIYGDANTWWVRAEGRYPRSSQPAPGSVLVVRGYRDTGRGHVAVVTRIESSRLIIVDHANWLNGGEISVDVPVLDVSPDNDWSQIRVWTCHHAIPRAHGTGEEDQPCAAGPGREPWQREVEASESAAAARGSRGAP
jgi:surface antigen